MRSARSAIVFLAILTMGLSLSVLPEDVAETAFDESETQPYESNPLLSILVRPMAARTTKAPLSSLHPRFGAPSLFAPGRVSDTDAKRATNKRVSLALLCTLLC